MSKDGSPVSRPEDRSNGYEAAAETFAALRSPSTIGCALVRRWSATLTKGSAVLDVGAGHGLPLTGILVEAGFDVHALEAAPSLAQALGARFPSLKLRCEPVEESDLFGRRFAGILAVGLVFLLTEDNQRRVLTRLARAIEPEGSLLFSAPWQDCTWDDVLTGRTSRSLGREAYSRLLSAEGLALTAEETDEGGSHHFIWRRI